MPCAREDTRATSRYVSMARVRDELLVIKAIQDLPGYGRQRFVTAFIGIL